MTEALSTHLAAYRAQLKGELLEGAAEYSRVRPTRRPDLYPTVYDYLNQAMTAARQAAADGDAATYETQLGRHQEGMTVLLEEMVADELWDYKLVDEKSILGLIELRGWPWFKFCKKSLECVVRLEDKVVDVLFIPRYAEKYRKHWDRADRVVFDASEMGLLLAGKGTTGDLRQRAGRVVLEMKAAAGQKILECSPHGGVVRILPIERLNLDGHIDDWTLPLFRSA